MAIDFDKWLIEALIAYPVEDLKQATNDFYSGICRRTGGSNAFGVNGAKEYVVAFVLFDLVKYTCESTNIINSEELRQALTDFNRLVLGGIVRVITGQAGPLEFSDFMDNLLSRVPVITNETWSAGYRIVERRHKWVESQPFAREVYKSSLLDIQADNTHNGAGNNTRSNFEKSSGSSYGNKTCSQDADSNFVRKNEHIGYFEGDIGDYPLYITPKFYITAYACPICGRPLYKTLFHELEQLSTDEGRILVERIFTCENCRAFFASDKYLDSGYYYQRRLNEEDYRVLLGHYDNCGSTSW